MNLFASQLAADPACPRLSVYDELTGARLDFSAQTLDNWAAKVANMLREEFDLDPGAAISLDLPCSWQAAAIIFGAFAAGVEIREDLNSEVLFLGENRAPDLKEYLDSLDYSGEVAVVSEDPMGRGVEESGGTLPLGCVDFAPTARFYGDVFPEPTPHLEELLEQPSKPERVLSTGWTGLHDFKLKVAGPIAAGGSAVVVTGMASQERLERIAEAEKVTARL